MADVIDIFTGKAVQAPSGKPDILSRDSQQQREDLVKKLAHIIRSECNDESVQDLANVLNEISQINFETALDQARICMINTHRSSPFISTILDFMASRIDLLRDPIKKVEYLSLISVFEQDDVQKTRMLEKMDEALNCALGIGFDYAYSAVYAAIQIPGADKNVQDHIVRFCMSPAFQYKAMDVRRLKTFGDVKDLQILAEMLMENSATDDQYQQALAFRKSIDVSDVMQRLP